MARQVEAYDLELYAINTGKLYKRHLELARKTQDGRDIYGIEEWIGHVKHSVLERYRREIEPVSAKPLTIQMVARSLRDYYQNHLRETAALSD
jgi:hypothetical protein